jgi:uncharacterized damage-inducible protein DinB
MVDTPQALADRLREENTRVLDFFNNLSQEQWGNFVYRQDSVWNFHHLLAHFVSSEIGHKELILNVISGGGGAPANFEINIYNQREVERLSGESNSQLLILFLQERSNLAEFVSTLTMEDLARIGNDPYLGAASLLEIVKLTYRHLQIHLRDARRCL